MKENIKENITVIIIRCVFFIVGGIICFLIGLLLNRFFPNFYSISSIIALILSPVWIFTVCILNFIATKNIISSIKIVIGYFIFSAIIIVVVVFVVLNTYVVVKKFNSVVVKESEHFTVYVSKKYLEENDTEYLQNIIENIEKKYDAFISIYGTDEDNNKKISILIVDDFEKGIDKFFINTLENAAGGVMPITKNAIFINGYYSVGEDTFLHELQHVCMENRNRKKYSILYHLVSIFNYIYSRGSANWFTECFSGSIDCFNHFFNGKNSYFGNYNYKLDKSLMFYDWNNNTYSRYKSAESFMKYLYIKSNYDINIFKDILSHANLNNGIEAILKVTEERFGINTWGDLLIDWGYNSLKQSIYTNTIREKNLDSYINTSLNSDYEIISDKGELLKRGKKETVKLKLYSGTVMIVIDVLTAHEDLIVKDCGLYKIIANKSRKYNNYIEVDIIESSGYRVIHIDESDMEIYLPGNRELRLKYIPNGTKLRDIEGNKLIIQLEDKMVICKIVNGTYKIIETIPIFYRLNSRKLVITERRPKYRYRYNDVLYYYDDGSYTSDEVIDTTEKMQIKKFYRIIEEKKLEKKFDW